MFNTDQKELCLTMNTTVWFSEQLSIFTHYLIRNYLPVKYSFPEKLETYDITSNIVTKTSENCLKENSH